MQSLLTVHRLCPKSQAGVPNFRSCTLSVDFVVATRHSPFTAMKGSRVPIAMAQHSDVCRKISHNYGLANESMLLWWIKKTTTRGL